VRGKKLPAAEAERALELLGSMRLERYAHVPLLARIWQLRHNMWPYDAAYVALAEALDAELVTLDGTIETIPGVMCSVRNLRGEQRSGSSPIAFRRRLFAIHIAYSYLVPLAALHLQKVERHYLSAGIWQFRLPWR
jgi:hypothetical protein